MREGGKGGNLIANQFSGIYLPYPILLTNPPPIALLKPLPSHFWPTFLYLFAHGSTLIRGHTQRYCIDLTVLDLSALPSPFIHLVTHPPHPHAPSHLLHHLGSWLESVSSHILPRYWIPRGLLQTLRRIPRKSLPLVRTLNPEGCSPNVKSVALSL